METTTLQSGKESKEPRLTDGEWVTHKVNMVELYVTDIRYGNEQERTFGGMFLDNSLKSMAMDELADPNRKLLDLFSEKVKEAKDVKGIKIGDQLVERIEIAKRQARISFEEIEKKAIQS